MTKWVCIMVVALSFCIFGSVDAYADDSQQKQDDALTSSGDQKAVDPTGIPADNSAQDAQDAGPGIDPSALENSNDNQNTNQNSEQNTNQNNDQNSENTTPQDGANTQNSQ